MVRKAAIRLGMVGAGRPCWRVWVLGSAGWGMGGVSNYFVNYVNKIVSGIDRAGSYREGQLTFLRLGALVLKRGAEADTAFQRKVRQDAKAQRRRGTVRSAGKSG